jgi:hypothetical protein
MKLRLIRLFILLGLGVVSLACDCPVLEPLSNLEQLEDYDFIAHIKITSDSSYKVMVDYDFRNEDGSPLLIEKEIGVFTFSVIQKYKGETPEFIYDYLRDSSCDLGIEKGEEWLLFGSKLDGKMSFGACGYTTEFRDVQNSSYPNEEALALYNTLDRLFER